MYSWLQWKGPLNYFIKITWQLMTGWIQIIFISYMLTHDIKDIFIRIKFFCMSSFVWMDFLKKHTRRPFHCTQLYMRSCNFSQNEFIRSNNYSMFILFIDLFYWFHQTFIQTPNFFASSRNTQNYPTIVETSRASIFYFFYFRCILWR